MDRINIERYLHVGTARNPVYAPVGHKLTFIADYTGLPQVWELNRGDEFPVQTSFTKEEITFIKYVNGTSNRIIGMDVAGNEKQQLYLLKDDGEIIALTNSPEHIHQYGGSSPDGKWIAWSSNRRNPAFFDIYIQNLETLDVRLVFSYDGTFSAVQWSPNGKSILVERLNSPLIMI